MSEGHNRFSDLRDAVFVAVVAIVAFALGALATGLEPDNAMIALSGGMRGSSGLNSAEPILGPGFLSRSLAAFAPDPAETALELRQAVPAQTSSSPRVVSMPTERFSGEAAGRNDHLAANDPYDRRTYILNTASWQHRREWIGLENDAPDPPQTIEIRPSAMEPGSFATWMRADDDPRQILTRLATLSRRVPRSSATEPNG